MLQLVPRNAWSRRGRLSAVVVIFRDWQWFICGEMTSRTGQTGFAVDLRKSSKRSGNVRESRNDVERRLR